MAQRVQDHPDYDVIFQQAREEAWGENRERYQRLIADGRGPAADALVKQLDQQARQRAAVATQALRQFDTEGSPVFGMIERAERANPDLRISRPSEPATVPTLSGLDNQPPAPIPSLVPPLPRPSDAVPEGEGLMPQTPEEAARLQADAESAGNLAVQGVMLGAGGPVLNAAGRVASAGARTVARHPIAASAGFGGAGLVAAPASTQQPTPGSGVDHAQQALDRLLTSQNELSERQKVLRQDLTRFDGLRDNDQAAVRDAQQFLAARGYNVGTRGADGRMGAETRTALQDYRRSLQSELNDVGNQLSQLAPNLQTAQTRLSETQRAAEQEAGNQRLRDMEADVPLHRRALREYGPALGYALGLLGIGPLTRYGVTRLANRDATHTAARADALMADTTGGVPGRVGRVNQFWTEGGGTPAPFSRAAEARPYPFTPNPRAPAAEELYQPSRVRAGVENAGVAAVGTADYLLAQGVLIPRAQDELKAARDAVNETPNEANIRRLQAALDMAAIYSTVGNAGLPMIAGYATSSHFMPRVHARPNVGAAEAERARLDRLIPGQPAAQAAPTRPARPSPGDKPPEGSIWNETAQRWMGPAEPGRPGRPFLSGDYAPPRGRRRSE
jgi:hypothetical protein